MSHHNLVLPHLCVLLGEGRSTGGHARTEAGPGHGGTIPRTVTLPGAGGRGQVGRGFPCSGVRGWEPPLDVGAPLRSLAEHAYPVGSVSGGTRMCLCLSFSLWEKIPEGRMRFVQPRVTHGRRSDVYPHPARCAPPSTGGRRVGNTSVSVISLAQPDRRVLETLRCPLSRVDLYTPWREQADVLQKRTAGLVDPERLRRLVQALPGGWRDRGLECQAIVSQLITPSAVLLHPELEEIKRALS